MREKIDGWCLDKDELGIPKLVECQVSRGDVAGVVVQQVQDKYGALLITRTYGEGKTFFDAKRTGLRALLHQLEEHRSRCTAMLEYLNGLVSITRMLLGE